MVKHLGRATLLAFASTCLLETVPGKLAASPPPEMAARAESLPSLAVARGQARLLHETIHTTLRIVHHQYYREDEGLMLPAATMRKVFGELAEREKVELRWLAVNAHAVNVDHSPRTKFEQDAVDALSQGKPSYESAAGGVLRHVGPIALTSDCLKCHSPNRTNVKERLAGLLIAIPYQGE